MENNLSPRVDQKNQQRTNVFISYSHKDKRWLEQLRTMLSPLVRMGALTIWDDTQIKGGDKWFEEISKALGSAKVAVLLVSADFLASDFVNNHELPELLKAANQDGLILLWILVRHCMVEETVFAQYQFANDLSKPLNTLSVAKREEELKKICGQIKQAAAFDKAFELPPQKPVALKWTVPSISLAAEKSRLMQSIPTGEFVGFEKQQEIFKGMTDHSSEKQLMFVQASGMSGKTSLLHLIRSQCEKNPTPWCWIDFHGQPYDNPHFTLTQVLCDQLGMMPHNLNQALEGLSFTHSDLSQLPMKETLNRAFIADLNDFAAQNGDIVFLFDSFEDIRAEEEDWLLNTLILPVKRRELRKVIIVTAGRRWPKIEKTTWEEDAHLVDGLPIMSIKNLKVYAEKVGVMLSDEQAEFCWNASRGGNPLFMGMVVKNLRDMETARPQLQTITPNMDEQEVLGVILNAVLDQPRNGR